MWRADGELPLSPTAPAGPQAIRTYRGVFSVTARESSKACRAYPDVFGQYERRAPPPEVFGGSIPFCVTLEVM